MSETSVEICATRVTMLASALPAWPTASTPVVTSCAEVLINILISREASEDRCASARTSDATTAKPRPASPARAASTPAFSASRLVWNAMSSITPMMVEICPELFSMPVIASTAPRTTDPLSSASLRADRTIRSTSRAPSAAALTLAVNWSSAAAVSSSVAAWFSVRFDRSSAAWLISTDRPRICWAAMMTWVMVWCSRSSVWL